MSAKLSSSHVVVEFAYPIRPSRPHRTLPPVTRRQATPRHRYAPGADRGAEGNAGQHLAQEPTRRAINEHLEHPDGIAVFQHACKMGLEGIVSKRLGSRYRSGRSPDWLKFKNPEAPAVRREAEEDWAK